MDTAPLVALGDRRDPRHVAVRRVLMFDERAFRAAGSLDGGGFTLLPADR